MPIILKEDNDKNNLNFGRPSNAITGTINVVDNMITFTPDTALAEGTEYTVVMKDSIASTDGDQFPDDVLWSFTTRLSPMYTNISTIRMDIGEWIEGTGLTDAEIARIINDVSKWANFIAKEDYDPDDDTAEWFHIYVRYETDLKIMRKILLGEIKKQGTSKRLADLQVDKDTSFVPDLNMAINDYKDRKKEAEKMLRQGASFVQPQTAQKAGEYQGPSRELRSFGE